MLNPGESVLIQGSGAKPYVIKNHDGFIYSCSCPGWRNCGGAVEHKTCKHIKKVIGVAADDARIGKVPSAPVAVSPTASASVQATSVAGSAERVVTAAESDAATIIERVAKQGRKLRQDEKAALYGPPVLLAHPWDGAQDPTGWHMSEKLDGVRAWFDGEKFISRQGNEFKAPDWFKAGIEGMKLDGELFLGRQKFQQTISIVKRLDGGELWRNIAFMVFDAPEVPGPFEERMKFLESAFIRCLPDKPPYVKIHSHQKVLSREHFKQEFDRIVKLGGEGMMLRKPGSLYEAGRSHTLLKAKPFSDAEAVVIGHTPGQGRHKGVVGALIVRMPSGREFSIGTGLSDADRRSPPAIGATITYSYTELTLDGSPKCAAFVSVRDYE